MKKIVSIVLTATLSLGLMMIPAKRVEAVEEKNTGNQIVSSYIPLYESWKAEDINGNKLTDALIAFAQLDDNYKLCFSNDQKTSMEEVKRLDDMYPNLRVSLSIGGWGAKGFSEMVASDELRSTFVSDVVNVIKDYKLDGVDLDWEYPVGEGWLPDVDKNWADKENFTKLMRELRVELDKLEKENNQEYILSYATNPSEWAITNLEYKEIFNLVDRINIMGYAYEGSWSAKTGHASNLFNYKENPWGLSSDSAVKRFLEFGAAKEKIVLGVPAFSQEWYGVENKNNGLGQKFKGSNNLNMSFTQLKNEFINKNGFTRYWDDEAKQPYLYNGDMFISYEDEESIGIKMDYIKENNLGGIMVWQYFQDRECDLLDVMYEKANIKDWSEGSNYSKGDRVIYKGEKYECINYHKALSNWTPDLTPTLWKVIAKDKEWKPGAQYNLDARVVYEGREYKCIQAHKSSIGWTPDKEDSLWSLI